jgi:DNA-directed RNA polymerase specialized sigma24 family protein
MLNMGWSLQDIAQMAELPVRTVEQLIVTQVQRERELRACISS